jgi:beta-xylosidase
MRIPMNGKESLIAKAGIVVALLAAFVAGLAGLPADVPGGEKRSAWMADLGDGRYRNPIIFADYSDPDVVRVGDDFYMVASSFNCAPGLPLLHSRDLVNWTITGHVFQKYPFDAFNSPQHGNGVWAPSIRYHNGEYYVFFGDPDLGIFMAKTKNPAGPWAPLVRVKEARGWIDACPFWDEDGNAYLVHAWAKSRADINSILTVNRMSPDGTRLLDEGKLVFDGHARHPTIEGPKLYKRNGYYYIFAPAGGVAGGWQTVLRSKNIFGPYEDKIVMDQGSTEINGPHQGAWVELASGESWFIHFQDRGAYGRVVHLQPVKWVNDWPVVGVDRDGTGKGEPVAVYRKPDVSRKYPATVPQTSDEFGAGELGLQWQWHANFQDWWLSLKARPGWLRLFPVPMPDKAANLWPVPNLLLQKLPAPEFAIIAKLDCRKLDPGVKTGLITMGMDYSFLAAEKMKSGYRVIRISCKNANDGGSEVEEDSAVCDSSAIFFRIKINPRALCDFSYSCDGRSFRTLGAPFAARAGRWIGAKVGLFCLAPGGLQTRGYADCDWFRFE